MCRSIHDLRRAEPAATMDDARAAALQYVRKVSGYRTPSRANEEAFLAAVEQVADSTRTLLAMVGAPLAPDGSDPLELVDGTKPEE